MNKIPEKENPNFQQFVEHKKSATANKDDSVSENEYLPPELVKLIFSFLTTKEQETVGLVNKEWSQLSRKNIKEKQVELIKNITKTFKKLISEERLDPEMYQEEVEALEAIENKSNILDANDLLQVRNSLLNMRSLMVSSLKSVSNKDLQSLQIKFNSTEMPEFFKNLPTLVALYKNWDEAVFYARSGSASWAEKELANIVGEFVKMGLLNEAVSLAESIPEEIAKAKAKALKSVVSYFVQQGNIDKAIAITQKMTVDSYAKREFVGLIARDFLSKGKVDEAINICGLVLNKFNDPQPIAYALWQLVGDCLKAGRLDDARKVAEAITYTNYRSEVFLDFGNAYIAKGFVEEARKAVEEITDWQHSEAKKELQKKIKNYSINSLD